MKYTFIRKKSCVKKPTINVCPGDVCKLINHRGEHNVFIVVDTPDVRNKCTLCDLMNTDYKPNECAYYDFQCMGRMAFKSMDSVLENL